MNRKLGRPGGRLAVCWGASLRSRHARWSSSVTPKTTHPGATEPDLTSRSSAECRHA